MGAPTSLMVPRGNVTRAPLSFRGAPVCLARDATKLTRASLSFARELTKLRGARLSLGGARASFAGAPPSFVDVGMRHEDRRESLHERGESLHDRGVKAPRGRERREGSTTEPRRCAGEARRCADESQGHTGCVRGLRECDVMGAVSRLRVVPVSLVGAGSWFVGVRPRLAGAAPRFTRWNPREVKGFPAGRGKGVPVLDLVGCGG